ncbi:hypothetical protein M8J77_014965 [Diaphorina citri]|nr:hypothetical protein M8J77_014965 [Diaphorina citri]
MPLGHNDVLNIASYKYVLAGGISGGITRAVCQPFDVLKIRFQLQVESFDPQLGGKYRGLFQAVTTIVKEEGVRALWKGHVPAQSLSITYGCVQFATFELMSQYISAGSPTILTLVSSDFLCGILGSTVATVVSFPFDVIRTRLVAQGNQSKMYSGTLNAFYLICRDKPTILFRGLTPTLLQVAPQGGIQFTVYNILSHLFSLSDYLSSSSAASNPDPQTERRVLSPLGSLMAGSVAGLTSKVAIYPLDLAKKRIQVQGFDDARRDFGKTFQCRTLLDCLWKTYRQESLRGLYKGLSPSLLKAGVTSACHFTAYEHTLRLLS